MKIYEYEEVSAKDGGIIFQTIVSHDLNFNIINGITKFEQYNVNTTLHQLDVFPDLDFKKASATSTYYILSEAVILKQKLDLLTEWVKKRLIRDYEQELNSITSGNVENLTKSIIDSTTEKYFSNTSFTISIKTNRLVFRGVSSSLDSGTSKIVLKASTHMVDTLENQTIDNWKNVNLQISGNGANENINSQNGIANINGYDIIDKKMETSLVELLLPSLIINMKGDSIETSKIWSGDEDSLSKLLTKHINKISKNKGINQESIKSNGINNNNG